MKNHNKNKQPGEFVRQMSLQRRQNVNRVYIVDRENLIRILEKLEG